MTATNEYQSNITVEAETSRALAAEEVEQRRPLEQSNPLEGWDLPSTECERIPFNIPSFTRLETS